MDIIGCPQHPAVPDQQTVNLHVLLHDSNTCMWPISLATNFLFQDIDCASCNVMSAFANQLAAVIKQEFGGNQGRFADASSVNAGTISRLVREETVPGAETIQSFAQHLSASTAASLCGAWLRDLIPGPIRNDIGVWLARDVHSRHLKQPAPTCIDQLDPDTRDAIQFLASLALDSADARLALSHTAAFLRAAHVSDSVESGRKSAAAEALNSPPKADPVAGESGPQTAAMVGRLRRRAVHSVASRKATSE